MKKVFFLTLLLLLTIQGFTQIIKNIAVFYNDDQTVKGKTTYRELAYIGDSPFWAKPEKIDIVLNFFSDKVQYPENEIQIIIEELYQPTALANNPNWRVNDKRWVPHTVIFSGNTNFIKSKKIIVKNCQYQTLYYANNILYNKLGFRIVAIFHNNKTNKLERTVKTYYLPED